MDSMTEYAYVRDACRVVDMECYCRDYKGELPLCKRCIAVNKVAELLKKVDTERLRANALEAEVTRLERLTSG
jgi:hypothetical protein